MIQFPIVSNPYSHQKLSHWIDKLAQLNLLDFQVILNTLYSMQSEFAYNNLLEVFTDLTPLYPDELLLLEFDLKKDIRPTSDQITCPISDCDHYFYSNKDYNRHLFEFHKVGFIYEPKLLSVGQD
ncbi:MAG: hypothetical protein HeimC3_30590 [Candidatus Heimdallarchaeota archaeon LC_3]|nr:MAG: hypothetical protein HeimC3_30590 [Candidatus Heimdallarchaeota archaeon LC_3]